MHITYSVLTNDMTRQKAFGRDDGRYKTSNLIDYDYGQHVELKLKSYLRYQEKIGNLANISMLM